MRQSWRHSPGRAEGWVLQHILQQGKTAVQNAPILCEGREKKKTSSPCGEWTAPAPSSDHPPFWMEAVEETNSDVCITLLFSNSLKITEMPSKIKALATSESQMRCCWYFYPAAGQGILEGCREPESLQSHPLPPHFLWKFGLHFVQF